MADYDYNAAARAAMDRFDIELERRKKLGIAADAVCAPNGEYYSLKGCDDAQEAAYFISMGRSDLAFSVSRPGILPL